MFEMHINIFVKNVPPPPTQIKRGNVTAKFETRGGGDIA